MPFRLFCAAFRFLRCRPPQRKRHILTLLFVLSSRSRFFIPVFSRHGGVWLLSARGTRCNHDTLAHSVRVCVDDLLLPALSSLCPHFDWLLVVCQREVL